MAGNKKNKKPIDRKSGYTPKAGWKSGARKKTGSRTPVLRETFAGDMLKNEWRHVPNAQLSQKASVDKSPANSVKHTPSFEARQLQKEQEQIAFRARQAHKAAEHAHVTTLPQGDVRKLVAEIIVQFVHVRPVYLPEEDRMETRTEAAIKAAKAELGINPKSAHKKAEAVAKRALTWAYAELKKPAKQPVTV